MNDIATEITDSLSRSGKGGMSSQLGVVDGTAGNPGVKFNDDSDTGIYRVGANSLGIAAGGSVRAGVDTVGVYSIGGSLANPGISFSDDRDTGIARVSANRLSLVAGSVELARAEDASEGGLQVNNQKTGSGLERVLGTSDLGLQPQTLSLPDTYDEGMIGKLLIGSTTGNLTFDDSFTGAYIGAWSIIGVIAGTLTLVEGTNLLRLYPGTGGVLTGDITMVAGSAALVVYASTTYFEVFPLSPSGVTS
jgi:hypothetical protein